MPKDVSVRVGKAWSTLHTLDIIWKSEVSDGVKIGIFRAMIEMILLYRSTAWTLTQSEDKNLNGANTKMLRVVKNVTCQQRITNEALYAGLPWISTKSGERCLRFSGHRWRRKMKLLAIWFCGNRSMAKGASKDRLAHLSICLRWALGSPETFCWQRLMTGLAGKRESWGVDQGQTSSCSGSKQMVQLALELLQTNLATTVNPVNLYLQ